MHAAALSASDLMPQTDHNSWFILDLFNQWCEEVTSERKPQLEVKLKSKAKALALLWPSDPPPRTPEQRNGDAACFTKI